MLAATRSKGDRGVSAIGCDEAPFQEMIAYWLHELGLIREFEIKEIAKGTNLYRAMVKTSALAMQRRH